MFLHFRNSNQSSVAECLHALDADDAVPPDLERRTQPTCGVYLWGSVGSGKSMIMGKPSSTYPGTNPEFYSTDLGVHRRCMCYIIFSAPRSSSNCNFGTSHGTARETYDLQLLITAEPQLYLNRRMALDVVYS